MAHELWKKKSSSPRASSASVLLPLLSCGLFLFCFVLVRQFQPSRFWTFPLLFSMHVFHWELQLCLFNSTVRWCSLRMFKFFFRQVSFAVYSTPDTITYAEAEAGCERSSSDRSTFPASPISSQGRLKEWDRGNKKRKWDAAPWLQKESVKVLQASDAEASWGTPFGGRPGKLRRNPWGSHLI